MPGIVKVRVVAGKDLPVMDRASDLTDAFAEVRLGNATFKTDVCRKTLFPHWNSEWFRFEVDDEELLDEPLQIKVLDHDVYSAHDVIGKVNISLSPLLLKDGAGEIGGWFPIYDTLHGIRGYVNVRVRLDFFADSNKYNQASCRVKFFCTSGVPQGYRIIAMQGFVDALLVNDDPEYQWIDKIRSPRASNEARLRLFSKLSGEVHRRIGLKVAEASGNAVIGYHQSFDIEGESGIVVRGIGTAVTLIKEDTIGTILDQHSPDANVPFQSIHENAVLQTNSEHQPMQPWLLTSGKFLSSQFLRYRTISSSSDGAECVDNMGVTYAGIDSPENSVGEKGIAGKPSVLFGIQRKGIDDMEYPFFTIMSGPFGFIVHLGQIVSARSVKLLDKVNSADLSETRISWWHELRSEVKSHAKALGCNSVIGYSEVTSICEDVIVLTAIGTAAIVALPDYVSDMSRSLSAIERIPESVPETPNPKQHRELKKENAVDESSMECLPGSGRNNDGMYGSFSLAHCLQCHVPYVDADLPLSVSLSKCRVCRQGKVPDVIFTTIEPPDDVPVTGTGTFIQARVCRQKKKEKGEALAENVSQILPFLEYELHQQLMNKLKIKGMNSLFGWKTQISIGDQYIIGLVSATAVYLSALPAPPIFIVAGSKHSSNEEERHLMEIQKKIIDVTSKNKRNFNLLDTLDLPATPPNTPMSQSYSSYQGVGEGDSADPRGHLDLVSGVKEAYILEMDDKRDETILGHLLDSSADSGAALFGIQATPGFSLLSNDYQFLAVFQQRKFSEDDFKNSIKFSTICDDILKGMQFKVRSLRPCCLAKVNFDVRIPEDDFLQVTVTASVLSVADEGSSLQKAGKQGNLRGSYELVDDMVFPMEGVESHGDKGTERSQVTQVTQIRRPQTLSTDRKNQEGPGDLSQSWPRSQFVKHKDVKERPPGLLLNPPLARMPVIITAQSCLPNYKINQYLGNLNLFFIRESTSIKEDGGSNMFMQSFITEVHSVLKAHVVSLGGNAVVGYILNEIVLLDSPHKNQAQCLLNVSGDAAELQPFAEIDSVPHILSPRRRMSSSSGDSLPSYSQVTMENKEVLKERKTMQNVETEV